VCPACSTGEPWALDTVRAYLALKAGITVRDVIPCPSDVILDGIMVLDQEAHRIQCEEWARRAREAGGK
jgi:hypothetical protein